MESGSSMPHSQGLSNNPYPEPNQPNSPHWVHSNIVLPSTFYYYYYYYYYVPTRFQCSFSLFYPVRKRGTVKSMN